MELFSPQIWNELYLLLYYQFYLHVRNGFTNPRMNGFSKTKVKQYNYLTLCVHKILAKQFHFVLITLMLLFQTWLATIVFCNTNLYVWSAPSNYFLPTTKIQLLPNDLLFSKLQKTRQRKEYSAIKQASLAFK